MSHECYLCGEWCYCDVEDTPIPLVGDEECSHACSIEADEEDTNVIDNEGN